MVLIPGKNIFFFSSSFSYFVWQNLNVLKSPCIVSSRTPSSCPVPRGHGGEPNGEKREGSNSQADDERERRAGRERKECACRLPSCFHYGDKRNKKMERARAVGCCGVPPRPPATSRQCHARCWAKTNARAKAASNSVTRYEPQIGSRRRWGWLVTIYPAGSRHVFPPEENRSKNPKPSLL